MWSELRGMRIWSVGVRRSDVEPCARPGCKCECLLPLPGNRLKSISVLMTAPHIGLRVELALGQIAAGRC